MFNVKGYATTINKKDCEKSKCEGCNTSIAEKRKIYEIECDQDESITEKIVVFLF